MKKILLALTLLSAMQMFAQQSDRRSPSDQGYAFLTATCGNANTTCDSANTPTFGVYGDVIGPATLEVNTKGYGLATITVTGTYTGSTINFDFSDVGGIDWYQEICTRTDANIQEASEVLATNAIRAFECGVGAATRFRVRQSALSTGSPQVAIVLTAGIIEPAPTFAPSATVGTTDPCQNSGVLKSSQPVSIASATTTQIVALSAGKTIYVCGGYIDVGSSGTSAASALFEYGTGASCGTGTTTLTGAMGTETATATNNALDVLLPGGMTNFATASGNALCILSAGTTVAIHGWVTFVQQ